MDRTITLGGVTYKIGQLDPFAQFHITRRLAPILANLVNVMKEAAPLLQGKSKPPVEKGPQEAADQKDQEDQENQEDLDTLSVALIPIAENLAKMSDEDTDYIIHTCLAVCQREVPGGRWAPVQLKGGTRLMFEDIDMPTLMGLTINTIQDNLASFFPTGPRSSAATK